MRYLFACCLALLLPLSVASAESSFLKERKGFKTTLTKKERESEGMPEPPESLFRLIKYPSPSVGDMSAYLSVAPDAKKKHPAIIWITGGFPAGGGGSYLWEAADEENDQSARSYRHEEVVMMFPAFRGEFGNPGHQESFFGEVDDALAALAYLKTVDYVDPQRIFLGGHSTGGTLALLVAAATDEFAAVFSFGPVSDPAGYGATRLTYDTGNAKEKRLRAPIHFLDDIKTPTYVIEGQTGNSGDLREMDKATENPRVIFAEIKDADHFEILAPINQGLAVKVAKAKAGQPLGFTAQDIQGLYTGYFRAQRETQDLRDLAAARSRGVSIDEEQTLLYYLFSWKREMLDKVLEEAKTKGFAKKTLEADKTDDGREYFRLILTKRLIPRDLDAVFQASQQLEKLEVEDYDYSGWVVD